MAGAVNHEYHLVNPSRWPLLTSLSMLVLTLGGVFAMKDNYSLLADNAMDGTITMIGGALVVLCAALWWRDVVKESLAGDHSGVVQIGLRYGMILFIASEVMFFVAWFWAYFNASLFPTLPAPDVDTLFSNAGVDAHWPPEGIATFDPWHLPLMNTLILLLSGTTVTWAHHALIEGNREGLKQGLLITVVLGIFFSFVQAYEYSHAAFGFGGNIYGATFFMATGFHGFHVIVGTIFLAVCLFRAYAGHFTPEKHFGFEAAAWYWHFVDVVWLFLFVVIYIWGAGTPAH